MIEIIDKSKVIENKIIKSRNCDRCGKHFGNGQRNREYISGKWTCLWICDSCYKKDSRLADRRIGTLDTDSPSAKGDYYESVTCKVRNLGNINLLEDCYTVPIDHTRDKELGIIDSKGRLYDYVNDC